MQQRQQDVDGDGAAAWVQHRIEQSVHATADAHNTRGLGARADGCSAGDFQSDVPARVAGDACNRHNRSHDGQGNSLWSYLQGSHRMVSMVTRRPHKHNHTMPAYVDDAPRKF